MFFFFLFCVNLFEEFDEDHTWVEVVEDNQWKGHSLDDDPGEVAEEFSLKDVGFHLQIYKQRHWLLLIKNSKHRITLTKL